MREHPETCPCPIQPERQEQCVGLAPRVICEVLYQVAPLYAQEELDTPANVGGLLPNKENVIQALVLLRDVLFPGTMTNEAIRSAELSLYVEERMSRAFRLLSAEVEKALPLRWTSRYAQTTGVERTVTDVRGEAERVTGELMRQLPDIRHLLVKDVEAAYDGDPAALSFAEIVLTYPGLAAITCHRIAHALYQLDVPAVPRIMSEWTHTHTGIDIHPGARIGERFFIDHGTGVVIGETCQIGNRVKLYQGVTLGAKSFPLDEHGNPIKGIKRHPTIEDDVVIYAGATILGGDTVIGRGSVVGANVSLMRSVPPGSTVLQKAVGMEIRENGNNG